MTYHYTESGLNKVYLANGYEHLETEFGKATMVHNPQGLQRHWFVYLSQKPYHWCRVQVLKKRVRFIPICFG